jgi:hypothetical protein
VDHRRRNDRILSHEHFKLGVEVQVFLLTRQDASQQNLRLQHLSRLAAERCIKTLNPPCHTRGA